MTAAAPAPAPVLASVLAQRDRRWRSRFAVGGAVASGVALALTLALPPYLPPPWNGPSWAIAYIAAGWLAFTVAARLVCAAPMRAAVVLVLVGAVALPVAASVGPPRSSDDLYRYLWDGRVQAAGVDPYRYPPAAPGLVPLRDEYLWPERTNWCVAPHTVDAGTGEELAPGCTLINRPTVHTIYPPVAQVIFLAVHVLSPAGTGYLPIRLAAGAFAVATTVLLLLGLHWLRLNPRRAVLWAWCPAVALEAASNAHIDVAAAFLTGAALLVLAGARSRRASAAGGALLGLAITTKLTPVLVVASVLRRRPATVLVSLATAAGAVYLPHLLAVGAGAAGHLPGYLREEGYHDGSRFALLTWLLPAAWTAPVAVALLATVAGLVARTADPQRPWRSATVMTGAALLVAAPSYPWYALLLVLLVALGGPTPWLAVAAAAYPALYAHDLAIPTVGVQRIGYGAALVVVLLGWLARTRPRRDR